MKRRGARGMAGPGTNNTETPYRIWGFDPPSPEPDTKKLDALLDSLNGSAERFQTLWFSFLGLTLYLAIAALATTHRNLLLGEPQILPILNIKVELPPFYVIAPLLHLVFHFYLLTMLVLLARTAAVFDKQLRTTIADDAERERYRARVENAFFLQVLVGMKNERLGMNALLLATIALITIVLAPLATLILMQMMFLPYHHLRITWWHRGVVTADLVLILVMTFQWSFSRGVRKAPLVLGVLSRKPRWLTAVALCAIGVIVLCPLAYWLSFKEGRWAGEPRPSSFEELARWMEGEPPPFPEDLEYTATAKGVVFGLFPDRLKLNDEAIVGEAKLEETKKEIASRGGDFVPTIKLDRRDLQAADLSGADLRGVALEGAAMQGAYLNLVRLDGARLVDAGLQGADLSAAQLQGANLADAQLQGADLWSAQLEGAALYRAQLQGANLRDAQLQGARLASLRRYSNRGTVLASAGLQGAHLSGAQLQGADLGGARLQGANLSKAQLQGANIFKVQLQGADLSGADLTDSDFAETFVFRTNIANADLSMTAVGMVDADPVRMGDRGQLAPLTRPDIDGWIAAATRFASADKKDHIVKRFDRLKSDFQAHSEDVTWSGMGEASLALDPNGAQHRQRLVKFLANLACEPADGTHVARGLVQQRGLLYRLAMLGDQLAAFRASLEEGRKAPEKCPGVVGFTEDDWRRLEAIKPN
jgi:uncharacterized protein YjbI with pentapeptide repeats